MDVARPYVRVEREHEPVIEEESKWPERVVFNRELSQTYIDIDLGIDMEPVPGMNDTADLQLYDDEEEFKIKENKHTEVLGDIDTQMLDALDEDELNDILNDDNNNSVNMDNIVLREPIEKPKINRFDELKLSVNSSTMEYVSKKKYADSQIQTITKKYTESQIQTRPMVSDMEVQTDKLPSEPVPMIIDPEQIQYIMENQNELLYQGRKSNVAEDYEKLSTEFRNLYQAYTALEQDYNEAMETLRNVNALRHVEDGIADDINLDELQKLQDIRHKELERNELLDYVANEALPSDSEATEVILEQKKTKPKGGKRVPKSTDKSQKMKKALANLNESSKRTKLKSKKSTYMHADANEVGLFDEELIREESKQPELVYAYESNGEVEVIYDDESVNNNHVVMAEIEEIQEVVEPQEVAQTTTEFLQQNITNKSERDTEWLQNAHVIHTDMQNYEYVHPPDAMDWARDVKPLEFKETLEDLNPDDKTFLKNKLSRLREKTEISSGQLKLQGTTRKIDPKSVLRDKKKNNKVTALHDRNQKTLFETRLALKNNPKVVKDWMLDRPMSTDGGFYWRNDVVVLNHVTLNTLDGDALQRHAIEYDAAMKHYLNKNEIFYSNKN